jgi:prolyl oligopeptidase
MRLPSLPPGLPALLFVALAGASAAGACTGEPEPHTPPPALPPPPSASAIAPPPADSGPARPPLAARRPVSDTYHGTTVTDDYRWLEDGKDPAVIAWSDAQNTFARDQLGAFPQRKALEARVTALVTSASALHFDLDRAGGRLFALKQQPPKPQPLLVVLRSADDAASEQVVLDPSVLDARGSTTIDWYVPSPDGKLVAVSLSKGGSESGDVHIYEVDGGKEHPKDSIARVHGGTAGGTLLWRKDGKGFWYTRYPREGERAKEDLDFYQQVWFHELGGATPDRRSLTDEIPRIAECELHETSDDGRFALLEVKNGDGGEAAFYVLDTRAKAKGGAAAGDPWVRVARFEDHVVGARLGKEGGLWLRSLEGSPRGKILRLDPAHPDLTKARVVVPESETVIQGFTVTKKRIYVTDLVGGPNRIRVLDLKGQPAETLALPGVASVRGVLALDGDDLLVRVQTYTEPPAWWSWSPGAKPKTPADKGGTQLRKTALAQTTKADFSGIEVTREMATSKDGTRVPMSFLRKRGAKMDGQNPTVLYGYGGYGVSLTPRFAPHWLPWLEQGGTVAIANLRGGGEMGESWHQAGMLTKKQNVFDDFFACARWLIDQKWTSSARLAIEGASNGGLLMGAAVTQHPELFAAVVSHVGIYDMLRVETTPNGAFNVTEFGTVKDKAQFDALHAYSPIHQVKDGTSYPPVLFLTGQNDPRVDPYNSRKMTARLQAANPAGLVLLRTSADTGHGMGTPLAAQIQEDVDVYAFLFTRLGVSYQPVP